MRRLIFAVAFEPYQELFQGVICCLHSDFRIGGLKPGETKKVRGKIYVVPADERKLGERYRKDFPEHAQLGRADSWELRSHFQLLERFGCPRARVAD